MGGSHQVFSVLVDDVDADADEDECPDETIRAEREREVNIIVCDSGDVPCVVDAHPLLYLYPCDDDGETKKEQPESTYRTEHCVVQVKMCNEKDDEDYQPDNQYKVYHVIST